ncbi:MAG: two-component regulator propeller domain-containing protein [Bacteroidales bacterium]|jgi:signal transduction histidine kinase/ligand-binding sensor domain-containing protein/DNA-binding response OmpR family regulator
MKQFILTAFLLYTVSINAFGSGQYYFRHYKSDDGLPNNTVTCTVQDHFGFLWFGTKDGICRFNGQDFIVLEDPNLKSCINGMTFSLCEDHDGMLWCCSTKGTGYYNLYTTEVTCVKELEGYRFFDINVDKDNNVWFVSSGSVFKLDRSTGEFVRYSAERHFNALHSCVDSDGYIWFTTYQGDIRRYNPDTDYFEIFPLITDKTNTSDYPIHIKTINEKYLLISTNNYDLIRLNINSGDSEYLINVGHPVNCLLPRTDSEYWIGTLDGLVVYDDHQKSTSFINDSAKNSLSNTNVISILQDNEGNVWMGTYYGGLNLWHNRKNSFGQIFFTGYESTFYGKLVHALTPDENDNLWIGTEDGNLNKLIFKDKTSVWYSNKKGFPSNLNIHGLLQEKNMLWIATYNKGLFLYDLESEKIFKHTGLPTDQCVCILKTCDNSILIGTTYGLYKYERSKDIFEFIDGPGHRFIHTLYQDSFGTVWVGTYGSGIYYSKDDLKTFTSIQSETDYGLRSNYITYFFEDSSHTLWVATEGGGLCRTSLEGNVSFTHITRNNGLPSNIACAVTQDQKGLLWVSTTKGLATIDPLTDSVLKVYLDNNGIVGNQFSYGSCYQFPSGQICLGTTNGMITFNPANLKDPITSAPLYIHDIHTGTDENFNLMNTDGRTSVTSDKIRIRQADASYLSISFSALYYSNVCTPFYEYTLSSGRKQSIKNVSTENTIVFTDMNPGHYRFNVKVLGSNSPESHKSLSIVVVPPFHKSVCAYIVYFLIIGAIVLFFIILLFKKRKIEETSKLEQMESLKQKEIYDAKINFFTNITHEIRTPLSLIKMPVEKIILHKEYTEASKEDMMTIKANTNRLLELTNQLLDIRKMEKNQITVNFLKEDIGSIVSKTCEYFAKAAKEQHISYTVHIPEKPVMMMCSAEIVKKMVSNLLSNAIKYCKNSIELSLTVSDNDQNVVIRVTNDGALIPDNEREKIFTPFYQIRTVSAQLKGSNGTGLGLPYARTLANLHKGSLVLDSAVKDENSFVLTLPLDQPSLIQGTDQDAGEDILADSDGDSSKHTILIVEDAAEMRRYLCKELSSEFNVFTASNGEEGMNIIKEQKIDLVVTDLMMPVMDGCQLCNFIKNDIEYSHIPVILLTAAVGVETRIETLQVGADGYIEKPFAIELLMANISNLFKNKEIAYRQFANSPLSHFNSVSFNNVEKAFMDKLHETIMKHMAEQDLGIDTLTQLIGTSKSTLYRKIKANTGLNTNEYIRICRLKKAAEMLSTQEYRVNEVAYLVGFSSPSYFTTSFHKQFNISPSAFVKNLRMED